MKLFTLPRRLYSLYNEDGISEIWRGVNDFIYYRRRDFKRYLRRKYVEVRYRGKTVERKVNGYTMLLDTSDPGITTDLIIDRIREPITTRQYEQELSELLDRVDGEVVVIDIGANIGYTVLTAAGVLGERGDIYAIEPVPENVKRCHENITINGFEELVTVDSLAIGNETGTAELYLSPHSNLHSFRVDEEIHQSGGTLPVEILPLTEYIENKDLEPEQVNVLRMDVEGYEASVLKSAEPILRSSSPMVLQIELHGRLLSDSEREYITSILSETGFKIKSAVYEGKQISPADWDIIKDYSYLRVVAIRG